MKIRANQYGYLLMAKGKCLDCGDTCLICKDKTSSCCNAPVKPFNKGCISKETGSRGKRSRPDKYTQNLILRLQNNKCYWCDRTLDVYVLSPKGLPYLLKPVWDHYIPFSYSQSCSRTQGFVASCNRCNIHKSAKIIYSVEEELELKEILKRRWYNGGWTDLF